jgi:hypothetical protein
MPLPEYQNARGSNAGDDFHELWVLRQAISLLELNSPLAAITVEGLRLEDEKGVPKDTWDGVDCTYYYGDPHLQYANRIVVDQVKYSGANPNNTWTVTRLTRGNAGNLDNSLIGALAKIFKGIKHSRKDLVSNGQFTLRLISNQSVNRRVLAALSPHESAESSSQVADRKKLFSASGLSTTDFDLFINCLDFSKCGGSSRFGTELKILTNVATWIEDDSRPIVDHLRGFVRRMMMPESKGELITRETFLAQLDLSDLGALFPCPSAIQHVNNLVPREEGRKIAELIQEGTQRICFHGVGGSGKTTLLQDIAARLPMGSQLIAYDCYGAGSYLHADAFRHRPQDAFLQLANELAVHLRTPLVVTKSPALDYPRVFKQRLARASELVGAISSAAKIVIVVDAADNSITAAKSQAEKSFVTDFLALGGIPSNACLLISCRTGRLPEMHLPPSFGDPIEIRGFSRDETAAFLETIWGGVPPAWLDDFQHLSGGNPRVQSYAIEFGKGDPSQTLEYLRPSGKSLNNVFEQQIEHTRNKSGADIDFKRFFAGLVALARPIPVDILATVAQLSNDEISDICSDLAPGIQLRKGLIEFADEDFEHFVRTEADTAMAEAARTIADYFVANQNTSAYAATHIASALLRTGRRAEVIALVTSGSEPIVIRDPVLRRQVQLERLKLAMTACREVGTDADAIFTILVGAEAVKSDEAIRSILGQNPDLAAAFARDTIGRIVLRDSQQLENHGTFLFHFLVQDAVRGDRLSVREGFRQLYAWLQRRKLAAEPLEESDRSYGATLWAVSEDDISCEIEAILRIDGPHEAVSALRRWSPKDTAIKVAVKLANKLVSSGDYKLVEECITQAAVSPPWDLFLLVPLALSGRPIDVSKLEVSLAILERRGLIKLDRLREIWPLDHPVAEFLETVLTACEIVIANRGTVQSVAPTLKKFADSKFRYLNQLRSSQIRLLDISLRAFAILQRANGVGVTVDDYLIDPDSTEKRDSSRAADFNSRNDARTELEAFLSTFTNLYDFRAQLILKSLDAKEIVEKFESVVSRSRAIDYRLRRQPDIWRMRTQAALTLSRLTIVLESDLEVLFDQAFSLLAASPSPFDDAESRVLGSFSLNWKLHVKILQKASASSHFINQVQVSAEEKVEAFVRLSRLLLPLSLSDAQILFNQAISASGEVNEEAVNEMAVFESFSRRGASSMSQESRRVSAARIATVASDAWLRLGGQEQGKFPWHSVGRALAYLDTSIGLSACGRWEDAGSLERSRVLPAILEVAFENEDFSLEQVTALSPLMDNFDETLVTAILHRVRDDSSTTHRNKILEEIARDEALRFDLRESVTAAITKVTDFQGGKWVNLLKQAVTSQKSINLPEPVVTASTTQPLLRTEEILPIIEPINIDGRKLTTREGLFDAVKFVYDQSPSVKVGTRDALALLEKALSLGDRASYLTALSQSVALFWSEKDLLHKIFELVDEWRESPSVREWSRANLLQLVVRGLMRSTEWITYDRSLVFEWLAKSGASAPETVAKLLEDIEANIESFEARDLYLLSGFLGNFCDAVDSTAVVDRYAAHLLNRIPDRFREVFDLTDIPLDHREGLARYVFALMSDVDLRVRWRAVHVLRKLARLGDLSTIEKMVSLYGRTTETSYRKPGAPFYWMASRVWLLIALDRIAGESPTTLHNFGEILFATATNEDFPHILIRNLAKSAFHKLVEAGVVSLRSEEMGVLAKANLSPLPRRESVEDRKVAYQKYMYDGRDDRRFHFDDTDTLPYLYSRAVRGFADVDREEFLDVAENWIVDVWKVTNNPWRWDDEPRNDRLSGESYSSRYGDGALQNAERYHRYLEWHAMWCAIGELLKTRALVLDPGYDCIEDLIEENGLTEPPIWQSDLVEMKPFEPNYWVFPNDIDKWVDHVTDEEFFAQLGLPEKLGITVAAYHEDRTRNSTQTVRVSSSLVASKTAASLVRALQTVTTNADYRLPTAGAEFEIEAAPYKLTGWLTEESPYEGIDKSDPFRLDIYPIQVGPATAVVKYFGLRFLYEPSPSWQRPVNGDTAFRYHAWSDYRFNERGERVLNGTKVYSSGYRLLADRQVLREFLTRMDMDLIVEIEINKRNTSNGSRYHSKNEKDSTFDRVILFRKSGAIEDAEGRVGAWTTSG